MLTNYINIQHHCTLNVVTHMLLFIFLDDMHMGTYIHMVFGFNEGSIDGPCHAMVCLYYT